MSNTLHFPETNPLRFAITNWKSRNADDRKDQRFRDFSIPYGKDRYFQPWQTNNVIRFQFKSSFDTNLAVLKNYDTGDTVLGELLDIPVQWPENILAYWSDGTLMKWPGTASNLTTLSITDDVKQITGSFTLDGVAEGDYYLEVTGSHTDGETYTAVSEPINIKATQEGTILIRWWNNSVFAGVDWTNGDVFEMRVKGWFNKKVPSHTYELARNALRGIIPVGASKDNFRELKIWDKVPDWVVHKLNEIGQHQNIMINGVKVGFIEPMEAEVISDTHLWVPSPKMDVAVDDSSYSNKLESLTRVSA